MLIAKIGIMDGEDSIHFLLSAGETECATDVLHMIAEAMDIGESEIEDIEEIKKGMTNSSFKFRCRGGRYIIRIPGEGSDKIIDRKQEYEAYRSLLGRGICDDIVYLNPKTGLKVTEFWQEARVCDAALPDDVEKCMRRLREVHELGISVNHEFDLFGRIDDFEKLRKGESSIYRDYSDTKDKVYELKGYIDAQPKEYSLSHIDAVSDNFLLVGDEVKLIDWEYSGMHDPHIDIAMFAVYSSYDRAGLDRLIDMYFTEGCGDSVRAKIYCYASACGLLWSNWCEYKRLCGVEFGEYAARQYRYARDYYKTAKDAII